jgi:hypothetical protein
LIHEAATIDSPLPKRPIRGCCAINCYPAFDCQKLFCKIRVCVLISYLTSKTLPIYLVHTQQGNNETQTGDKKMITSRKQLAVALSYGPVEVAKVGKAVQAALKLWASRGEVVIENGFVRMAK